MTRRASNCKHADACESLVERLAIEQLHHDVRASVSVVTEVEDLDDPRIRDRRGGARLVEETRHDIGSMRELGVQHLDGRTTTKHRVLGEPHGAHAALTDLMKHSIRPDLRPSTHAATF